jgi:hypothetical protein
MMSSVIPEDVMVELARAAERAALDVRDLEEMSRASKRLERAREELRKRYGELNLAVELIRQGREEG